MLEKQLKRWTGGNTGFWVAFLEQAVVKNTSQDPSYDGYCDCRPDLWMSDLTNELWPRVRERCVSGQDGNLAFARSISIILVVWFTRVCRSKCYDPTRSIKLRRVGMKRLVEYASVLAGAVMDESKDHLHFPDQEWDCPFPRSARYEPNERELRWRKLVETGAEDIGGCDVSGSEPEYGGRDGEECFRVPQDTIETAAKRLSAAVAAHHLQPEPLRVSGDGG